MLKILNAIFMIYYASSTIVIILMLFLLDYSFETELMLGLTIVAVILRLIIVSLEKKKNDTK